MTENVFELTDIFDDVNEKNVKKNIEYIIRREKLWSPNFSLVFPVGGLQEVKRETKGESGYFQYDFEVFSTGKGTSKMPLAGTSYGTISNDEIIDMTIEVKKTGE